MIGHQKYILINRMLIMSAISIDAFRESFAKAQNRFVDCFTRQIVPDSMHSSFRIRYMQFCGFSLLYSPITKVEE